VTEQAENPQSEQGDFFDQLVDRTPRDREREQTSFTVGFRGYDRDEVDASVTALRSEVRRLTESLDASNTRVRDEIERVREQSRRELEELSATSRQENEEASHTARRELEEAARLAREQAAEAESARVTAEAKAAEAAEQIAALTAELAEAPASGDESSSRQQFEAVLRVAEEQARSLIQNAAVQSDRLLESAREEVAVQRADLEADVARIKTQAQHDADQLRLRASTEYTAHQALIERESAHSAEKAAQAEREAAAIRSEAEKGAAALRSMVTREVTGLRTDAERDVREANARTLEFEESLTRRQDDAQQEFLVLHEQAVAHAERITADANEQVTASLDHAKRISAKADDYERIARTQAQSIEADARSRARETLERASLKAQKIVDTVSTHTNGVLRDAEDRARQLRWQQQQLTSFMAEVRELIRPDGVLGAVTDASDAATFDFQSNDVSDEGAEDVASDSTDDADATDVADATELDASDSDAVSDATSNNRSSAKKANARR